MARPPQTVSNMVRSMIVVFLSVLLILIGTAIKRSAHVQVDYRSTQLAAERLGLSPLAPEPLPPGWRAVSVNITQKPFHWHLGFTTATGRYAGIEQGGPITPWLKSAEKANAWQGWQEWNSTTWRALTKGEVVVCGDASWSELRALAVRLGS